MIEVVLVGVAEKKKRKEKRGTGPLLIRLHHVYTQASGICGERGILFADPTIRLP